MDFFGECLPVAEHLQREGVDVVVSLLPDIRSTETSADGKKHEESDDKKKRMSAFDGIVKKVTPEKMVQMVLNDKKPEEAFFFAGFNLVFEYAEQLKDCKMMGLYCTEEDRKLEVDRAAAKKFVEANYPGLEVAEEHEFSKVADAIQFLQDTDSAWVAKGFDESAPTSVPDSDDPEKARDDITKKLEKNQKEFERGGFLLEKKIANAVEITPEALFVDGKLVATTVDIELKKIGAGDISFLTGCSADLVFTTDPGAQINEMAFPPAVYKMAKAHKGVFIFDASILFDPTDGTPYFSEFCSNRAGFNCLYSELALVGSCKEFFEALMEHRNPYENAPHKFASSVRVFNFKNSDGKIVTPEDADVDYDEEIQDNVWNMDVKMKGDQLVTVGADYQLAVVTGTGDSIPSAAKDCYNNLEGFNFPNKYTRPLLDYLSKAYPGAIQKRYAYGLKNNLF